MGVIVKKTVFIIGTVLVVGLGAIFGTMLIKTIQYTIEESAEKDLEKSQDLSYKEISHILQDKANSNQKTDKTSNGTSYLEDSHRENSDMANSIPESERNRVGEKEIESSREFTEKNIEDGFYANADGLSASGWEEPSVEANSSPKIALNIKNPSISIDAESVFLLIVKKGRCCIIRTLPHRFIRQVPLN